MSDQRTASTTLLRKLANRENDDPVLAPELLLAADELDRLRAEVEALRKSILDRMMTNTDLRMIVKVPSVEELADAIMDARTSIPADVRDVDVYIARSALRALGRASE